MSTTGQEEKASVRRYWEDRPCGSSHATAEQGSQAFFREVEETRYALEPFIPSFAEFERWRGRRVLEVGVGLGTDFTRFARAGAELSGIDLTEASVELVRTRLQQERLEADLRRADAEQLPYADQSFDLVYSWGVLHHTPDTARAVEEVRRVLRPGGEARVMLYSRRSWVVLGLWLRYGLARGRPFRRARELLAEHMESAGTKAYTTAELQELFAGFRTVELRRFVTPYDRRVGGPLARLAGPRFGWFVGIRAVR
jgi:ubiquinone/menaquinone biosynthesis C-methylase UbiE